MDMVCEIVGWSVEELILPLFAYAFEHALSIAEVELTTEVLVCLGAQMTFIGPPE